MKSSVTAGFRKLLAALPEKTQQKTAEAYALWQANPNHPSLEFKRIVGATDVLYSVRIDLYYRALAYREENHYRWFWIGAHAEYDKLLSFL